MLLSQAAQRFDGRLGVNMARITLYADRQGFKFFSQAGGQLFNFGMIRINAAKAELPFQDGRRSGKTSMGQRRRNHSAFRGPSQVKALHHSAALALGEFEKAR